MDAYDHRSPDARFEERISGNHWATHANDDPTNWTYGDECSGNPVETSHDDD